MAQRVSIFEPHKTSFGIAGSLATPMKPQLRTQHEHYFFPLMFLSTKATTLIFLKRKMQPNFFDKSINNPYILKNNLFIFEVKCCQMFMPSAFDSNSRFNTF
jgi:hypothetical protein